MKALRSGILSLLLASLATACLAGSVRLAPVRLSATAAKLRPKAAPPTTGYAKMDKPGPVSSPDPYFTLTLGEAVIYRDARDYTLAYYRPIVELGKRANTPLAEGVGDLAAVLDGFLFRYYKFESGGSPKWADVQVIVSARRPEEATLENVQERWPEVTRLLPLPFKLDATTGVRLTIPYPPRAVTFSQAELLGGDDDLKWWRFSTNTHPTPPALLSDADNDTLNETKTRDFTALITSDLSDMPSFQPILEIRATYSGWAGASPLLRAVMAKPLLTLRQPVKQPAPASRPAPRVAPGVLRLPRQLAPGPMIAANPTSPPARVKLTPMATARPAAVKLATPALLRAGLVRVIGTLKPREDINYAYSAARELVARIPIGYSKANTPSYDYYFLSDSGRFGGPYFEPSTQPDRPVRAAAPEGFSGPWYESHYLGRRLVWPAPRGLRLRWEVESGIRPSCRFSVTTGEGGALTAHLSYDLYPDYSLRQLSSAVAALSQQTGEQITLRPFTDLLDANQLVFSSGNQTLRDLIAAGRLSIAKLSPGSIDGAWLRVSADMPVDDWATFTLFMKLGALGAWDCGLLTGASSGMAEKVTFELNGDLLQTLGGPVVPSLTGYETEDGGYQVALDNYGLQPLEVRGLRFLLHGETESTADIWLEGAAVQLPGVGSASSFDQSEGASGSVAATVSAADSPGLKTLMDSGAYQDLGVTLTSDMIAPSTDPAQAGGADPDILFGFLRSLCYQYIGSSEIIQVPIGPAELSQWQGYRSGRIALRFQGYVYTRELDLSGTNRVDVRRLPREGAYASSGKPGEADLLEYRATFVKQDDTVVNLPAQTEGGPGWLTGDISGVYLDMTQAQ